MLFCVYHSIEKVGLEHLYGKMNLSKDIPFTKYIIFIMEILNIINISFIPKLMN